MNIEEVNEKISDHLTPDIIEKLDERMNQLKGIGLSDIDISVINYALILTTNQIHENQNTYIS